MALLRRSRLDLFAIFRIAAHDHPPGLLVALIFTAGAPLLHHITPGSQ